MKTSSILLQKLMVTDCHYLRGSAGKGPYVLASCESPGRSSMSDLNPLITELPQVLCFSKKPVQFM